MKAKTNHLCNVLAGSMLALLGFESCDRITEQPDEYGAPYAEYQIRGTVTDEDGTPVEGIKAHLSELIPEYTDQEGQNYYTISTAQTVADGSFSLDHKFFYGEPELAVILQDEDGDANSGEFLPDTVQLKDMKEEQVEKGKSWYKGKFRYSFTRLLKKK